MSFNQKGLIVTNNHQSMYSSNNKTDASYHAKQQPVEKTGNFASFDNGEGSFANKSGDGVESLNKDDSDDGQ